MKNKYFIEFLIKTEQRLQFDTKNKHRIIKISVLISIFEKYQKITG